MASTDTLFRNKESRYDTNIEEKEISDVSYNMIVGLTILYGLLSNLLICEIFKKSIPSYDTKATVFLYSIAAIVGVLICLSHKNYILKFIGYSLISLPLGIVLSVLLRNYSIFSVRTAFFLTTIIVLVMLLVSTVFPKLFLGKQIPFLICILITLIVEYLFYAFGFQTETFTWVAAGAFSIYIGYDWVKANDYNKTIGNAIDSAMDLYLDISNLFLWVLHIFPRRLD